jgi:transposase
MVLPDVLGSQIGRLVAAEFADPRRLATLGVLDWFGSPRTVGCGSGGQRRSGWWRPPVLPCRVRRRRARQVLADDLGLLACLDAQIAAAEAKLAELLPKTRFAPLTTVPGWGTVRAANYAAAVGDLDRWPGARQLYRASGLSPANMSRPGRPHQPGRQRGAAAGAVRPRDRVMAQRSGSPALRPAAAGPRQEGRVIGYAMANRANKIAYALVRDQSRYDPHRWA